MQQAVGRPDRLHELHPNRCIAGVAPGTPEDLEQDQIADLIVALYRDNAPPRTCESDAAAPVSAMWKLLDAIDDSPHDTKAHLVLKLSQTSWFADFLTNSMIRKHSVNCHHERLTFGEMVRFLMEACCDGPPADHARRFCRRESGEMIFFEPKRALELLARKWDAPDGPSISVKRRLLQLEWARAWLDANQLSFACKSQQALARLVSKDTKIELLRIFYANDMPVWNDRHAIRVGAAKDMVWQFRPLQWLDDISNQWLGGKRRSMVLTEDEMRTIEAFSWFEPWIQGLRKKRQKREGKKLAKQVQGPLWDEPCEECDYTEATAAICGRDDDTPPAWTGGSLGFDVGGESQEV